MPEDGSDAWLWVGIIGFWLVVAFGKWSAHYEQPVFTP
jgi:hypothetical protein